MKGLHNYEWKLFKLDYFSIHTHILLSFSKKSFFRGRVEFDGKTEIIVCSVWGSVVLSLMHLFLCHMRQEISISQELATEKPEIL